MKKWYLIILCFVLIGCNDSSDDLIPEPEVIIIDENAYHNIKNKVFSDNTPYLLGSYVEEIDELYSNFYVETFDRDSEKIWSIRFRDLLKEEIPSDREITIYEDKMIIDVGGYITVHDILTGKFLWELETSRRETDCYVYRGMIYVLYHEDDFITGVDLDNGKKEIRIAIDESYTDMIGIEVNETSITAYGEMGSSGIKNQNAVQYTLEGEFSKYTAYSISIAGSGKVRWDDIEVSSSLVEDSSINIIDMTKGTSWSEAVKGYGEGEWIEIQKTLPTIVNELVIYNGDHTSEKNFNENAKIKKATINIGDAKTLKYNFETPEYGVATVIRFIQPIIADYIYITIEEAEPGSLYKNTCITDIYTQ